MMKKYNLLLLPIFIISIFNFTFLESIAVLIFFYNVINLFFKSNYCIPFKELLLTLYSLQFLFGPAIFYNGLEDYTVIYKMAVTSKTYFSYMIPVFLSFMIGLRIFLNSQHFIINEKDLCNYISKNNKIPFIFIIVGFISKFCINIITPSLQFYLVLLSSFIYLGVFILIFAKHKYAIILTIIVFIFSGYTSLSSGMFHDFLIWTIMLLLILSLKYKFRNKNKFLFLLFFVLFIFFIQGIKDVLRLKIWSNDEKISITTLLNVLNEIKNLNGGVFTLKNLGPTAVRFNQGWITTLAMSRVPYEVNHTYGKLTETYLSSAILPRFLNEKKLNAGDQKIFESYTGLELQPGTSMGLGLFTDAYIEFGNLGACLYVFIIGLFYSFIINTFIKISNFKYPIFIFFIFFIFNFTIRPDNESQTAFGYLFKSIILVFILFFFFKKYFTIKYESINN